jgi:hypothetical protein
MTFHFLEIKIYIGEKVIQIKFFSAEQNTTYLVILLTEEDSLLVYARKILIIGHLKHLNFAFQILTIFLMVQELVAMHTYI